MATTHFLQSKMRTNDGNAAELLDTCTYYRIYMVEIMPPQILPYMAFIFGKHGVLKQEGTAPSETKSHHTRKTAARELN